MPIPETQLETWSHQGSTTQSSATYNTVKNVLEANNTPYSGQNYKVFLQGSYGNSTNIYAESDVDIVIRLDNTFYYDIDDLSDTEKAAHESTRINATYSYDEFKHDVLSVLKSQFGSDVKSGQKAIVINANGSRRKADVLVSTQFRRYSSFQSNTNSKYVEGICFFNAKGMMIVNYPKQHSFNLTTKHQTTYNRLKPLTRIFKNIRTRMINDGYIADGLAPSYFIEGLLYNVPTHKIASNHQNCVTDILNWYLVEADKTELVCANEQFYLLREAALNCWTQNNCDSFVEATVNFWNEW